MLKERHRLALQAALLDGEPGAHSFESWRNLVPLDEADHDEFRILPLIYLRAEARRCSVPEMGRLKGVYRQVWVRNTLFLRTCAVVVGLLSKASIPTILLKGTAMFARWSAELGPRATRDIDILVPRSDARRAARLLAEAGWRRIGLCIVEQSTDADLDWWPGVSLTNADGVELDLHWRPLPRNTAPDHAAMFWADSHSHQVLGAVSRVFRAEDQLYHALLHGARWTDGAGLDWIVDAACVLRACPTGLDWGRIIKHGRRDRSIPAVAHQFRQLKDVLGIETPIADTLAGQRDSRLDHYVFRRYRDPHFSPRRGEITPVNFHADLAGRPRRSGLRALVGFVCRQWALERPVELLSETFFRSLGRPRVARRWLAKSGLTQASRATSLPAIGASVSLSDGEHSPFLSGWSGPEPSGRWTGDVDNILAFADDSDQRGDLLVALRAIPYLAPGHTRLDVDVFANGRHCASWRFEGEIPTRKALALNIPEAVRRLRPDRLLILVCVRNPGRPAWTGASTDTRRLGLFLESISFGPAEVADPFTAPLDFAFGCNDRLLICGWSEPEPDGRWTDGPRASLALRWPGYSREIEVVLVGRVFEPMPTDIDRGLAFTANGMPSLARITSDSERVTASLRARPVETCRGSELRLELAISRPRSPPPRGVSEDARALGFLLQRLQMKQIGINNGSISAQSSG